MDVRPLVIADAEATGIDSAKQRSARHRPSPLPCLVRRIATNGSICRAAHAEWRLRRSRDPRAHSSRTSRPRCRMHTNQVSTSGRRSSRCATSQASIARSRFTADGKRRMSSTSVTHRARQSVDRSAPRRAGRPLARSATAINTNDTAAYTAGSVGRTWTQGGIVNPTVCGRTGPWPGGPTDSRLHVDAPIVVGQFAVSDPFRISFHLHGAQARLQRCMRPWNCARR